MQKHYLVGHAIVSANDRIANADGVLPPELQNERDWELFQAALDRSQLVMLGRLSHEATPNARKRLRLIISSTASGLEKRDDAFWLNPAIVPLEQALREILPDGGVVGVVGGRFVFDLVGANRFDAFHLARSPDVILPDGRGLFAACEAGVPAEAVLAGGGLSVTSETLIDPVPRVTLTVWGRPEATP